MKTFFRIFFFTVIASLILFNSVLQSQGWHRINPGTTHHFYGIHFPSINTGYVAGDGIIMKSTDAGDTWADITPSANSYFNSVFFTDNSTGYAVEGMGDIIKTADGGLSWSLLTNITEGDLRCVTFPSPGTGYVIGFNWGGQKSYIYKTTDAGLTWTDRSPASSMVTNLKHACFLNPDTGFACGYGDVIKTTDGGLNWTISSLGPEYTLSAIHFTDPDTGYAVGWNSSTFRGVILKSVDGANTWTNVWTSNYEFMIRDVWFADSHTGYVTGEKMLILKTTDGGASWIQQYVANTDTTWNLYALHFNDVNNGWAVGPDGILVKTTTGGLGLNQTGSTNSSVMISPNPVKDNIQIKNLNTEKNISFEITDLSGKVLSAGTYKNDLRGIDVAQLKNGLYFLKLLNAGTITINKFIKQ